MLTKQQIIALAVEADLAEVGDTAESLPACYVESLAKFENLAYQRGVRDEQERCVKAFEKEADSWTAWPQAGAAKRKGVAAIYASNENANSATIPPSSTTE